MQSIRASLAPGKAAALCFSIAVFLTAGAVAQHLTAKDLLVVYNKSDPESEKLAKVYQEARGLPDHRVVGLDLPRRQDISRGEYEAAIVAPLRRIFDRNGWWARQNDAQGLLLPFQNQIRAILLMRGVPLRITPAPATPPEEGEPTPTDPISPRDEACVDSELALFGIESLPSKGVLKNAFYESKIPLSQVNAPYLVLTSRIDAPDYATAKRMITDAVATENTGLWGRAYVDVANKLPQGDGWLEEIVRQNESLGIPTVTDRFNDTLPKNYPMTDASVYYGWYDWSVSGPFLNTRFIFRPGAVAVHIHSFSAEQLSDPHKNWCAPLIVRGAAATVGNVYEPYLHLTHHLEILHHRLLQGWTFVEAAWASMPVASWQGVVLGDPLYRPFLHIDGTGKSREEDRDFRALRAASRQWPDKTEERRSKLAAAADKLSSGSLAEGLATGYRESKDAPNAKIWFAKAKTLFTRREDKLRQDMQLIGILREQGAKPQAVMALREAKAFYGNLPEAEAISGWLDILDPPPPPLADPTKIPK